MKTKEKVGAFVVRAREGRPHELLLFTHVDYPDAPIQIPGGGIEPGEDPDAAVRRELREEAGLTGLPMMRKLGVSVCTWEDRKLFRHCYVFDGRGLPEAWVQVVSGHGEDQNMRFAYAWQAIDRDFTLSGDLGFFLTPQYLPELYPNPAP